MSWVLPVVVGLVYGWGVVRVGAARWPWRRSAAFAAGLIVLLVAFGPVDARTDDALSAHTLQHSLVSLVAAPLLVLGAPIRLALRAQGRDGRRASARALGARPVRVLLHPAVTLGAFVASLALSYWPPAYAVFLAQPLLHVVDHALLLWAALLLWTSAMTVEPVPRPAGMVARLVVLTGAMTAMAVVGAVMDGVGRPLYDAYVVAHGAAAALADQGRAGGIMWMGGMVVAAPAALLCAWQALAGEERRQRVREEAEDRRAAAAVAR